MTETDVVMTIYVVLITVAFVISLKFASTTIQKTGTFLPQAIIAGTLNLVFMIAILIGWYLYAWGINEFLFFGGIVLGVGLLILSQITLYIVLFLKRKQWIQTYNNGS
ncbi:hypothetical protein QA612_17395 [Evansella sp. AB-P1]|uniref:hypothetical protein n=1 Tax=Evansella sp. AB-P1 TaxID=3037653 RepID=UPI00241DCB90|nr:hypothetical protein [Evansella sp. AB-P1]MDG5789237.1 hypothetical protein [Evansella sp. AB-P1]